MPIHSTELLSLSIVALTAVRNAPQADVQE